MPFRVQNAVSRAPRTRLEELASGLLFLPPLIVKGGQDKKYPLWRPMSKKHIIGNSLRTKKDILLASPGFWFIVFEFC
jgi:hypothetical protein